MRVGVIGIRSKHLAFFQKALRVCFPGGEHTITHIWGFDAPERISNHPDLISCGTPEALIDAVDAVVIATREGYTHAAFAKLCLEAGKPVFVDKPFACSEEDALEILSTAERTGTPCTGGSTIAMTQKVQQLKTKLPHCKEYSLSYQADPHSPFGGWYFYGSHLTDLCVTLFGTGWHGVSARQEGSRMTARVHYDDFTVTLRSSPEAQPFLLVAEDVCEFDDVHCYEAGMTHFCNVAQGLETGDLPGQVSSVRLLNAILTAVGAVQPYPG